LNGSELALTDKREGGGEKKGKGVVGNIRQGMGEGKV